MVREWAVYGSFPTLHNKQLGLHWRRSEAESQAEQLRRWIGGNVLIRVVWIGGADHE